MELGIAIGVWGFGVLIVGALVFGIAAQLVGDTETGYEWLVDGVAAFIGAVVASEFLVSFRTVAPVFDGLALLPALGGGLVLGLIVEVVTRYATGGTYSDRPMAA